jgi:hypothetical protein
MEIDEARSNHQPRCIEELCPMGIFWDDGATNSNNRIPLDKEIGSPPRCTGSINHCSITNPETHSLATLKGWAKA